MAIKKVLIVDDEPRFCESLRLLFNANNYEVVTANCGQDALTLLAQDTFDLAIIDVHLPDKLGTEIMDDVKARSPDSIVIFITGDANIDSALAALKCGAYDYLRKPFEFEELQKTVENALHQKRCSGKKNKSTSSSSCLKKNTVIWSSSARTLSIPWMRRENSLLLVRPWNTCWDLPQIA